MEYKVVLDDEQEKFLDIYLTVNKLRPEHKREDYPGLIATNFINSMMKRKNEFIGILKDKVANGSIPQEDLKELEDKHGNLG